MIGYPTNRLLMVIDDPAAASAAERDVVATGLAPTDDDDPAAASAAERDVVATGLAPTDVNVLVGDHGIAQLRGFGGSRGPLGRVVRMFQFMSMDQMPDFVMYEAALRAGRAVLAVRPRRRAQLDAARTVGERHGAHFANWFGRLSTEELSRWRGQEPEIPSYLRS